MLPLQAPPYPSIPEQMAELGVAERIAEIAASAPVLAVLWGFIMATGFLFVGLYWWISRAAHAREDAAQERADKAIAERDAARQAHIAYVENVSGTLLERIRKDPPGG